MSVVPEAVVAAVAKKPTARKAVKAVAKAVVPSAVQPATQPKAGALAAKSAKAPKAVAKGALKAAPKAAVKAAVKPVAKPKADKPVKASKVKLVRDSFTIPKPEYVVLDELKLRAAKLASPVKKSELIRAGIKALAAMADTALLAALKAVPAIKTGRPAKG